MPTAKALCSSFQRRFPWLADDASKYVSNRKDGGIDIYLDTGETLHYVETRKGWILSKGETNGQV